MGAPLLGRARARDGAADAGALRVRSGVDGVEAFYPTHTAAQVGLLCETAVELDLLTTGSSDFHGSEHKTFAGFRAFELYGHKPRLGPLAAETPAG